jgi:8-oxo-dGTP pyrophosphatase MutT (NUDIX family)
VEIPDIDDTVIWRVRASRKVYTSPWVEVHVDDVQLPDGDRIEHHVLRFPRPSVGAVVVNDDRDRMLLIWRHRHITDTWGWEIPAGWAEPDEDLVAAVAREIEEETGHRAATIEPMATYRPMAGISTMVYTVYLATDVVKVGEPTDTAESLRVEWVAMADIPELVQAGHVTDGPSLTAIGCYLGIHRALSVPRRPAAR